MFDIQKEAINFGSAQEQTSERCIKTVDKRFRPLHFALATPERYCNKFMNQDYIFPRSGLRYRADSTERSKFWTSS